MDISKNTRLYTAGSGVNLRSGPSTTETVIANVSASGTEIGLSSGRASDDSSGYTWYEFGGGAYGTGWIRSDLVASKGAANANFAQIWGIGKYVVAAGLAFYLVPKLLDYINGKTRGHALVRKK